MNELTVAYEDEPTMILDGTGGWSELARSASAPDPRREFRS